MGVVAAVVPFHSSYRPLWLAFGALSFDLLLAVVATSLLRQRLGHRAWRITHWLAYAAWPVALLHTVGTGSDVKRGWLLALCAICLAAVLVAVCLRTAQGWPNIAGNRFAALAGSGIGAIVLVAWMPSGPLAKGWARKAGTPSSLLGVSTTSTATAGRQHRTHTPGLDRPFRARVSGLLHQSQSPETGLVTIDMPLRPVAGLLLRRRERLRVLECLHRRSRSLLVAEDAHVDLGASKIGGDLDRGHGRESDARVAELFADERAQLALKQGVDPVRSLVRHG